MVRNWLPHSLRNRARLATRPNRSRTTKPWLEALETRTLPTTFNAVANYIAGAGPASVVAGDFDSTTDTKTTADDFAVVNSASNTVSVFLGNGNGTFVKSGDFQAGSSPQGIAVGEFDGDLIPDLVVTNNTSTGTLTILLGNGNGTFSPHTIFLPSDAQTNPYGVAVAQLHQTGVDDIIVANTGNSSGTGSNVVVMYNNNDGHPGTPDTFTEKGPYAVGLGSRGLDASQDFTGDGRPDLAVANFNSGNVTVLQAVGDGTFLPTPVATLPVGSSPLSVVAAKLQGSSSPADLVVANSGTTSPGTIDVILGNGDSTFKAAVSLNVGNEPYAVAAGDFYGNGLVDLAVANALDSTVSVLPGNGDGSFGAVVNTNTGQTPDYLATGDFNGDGKTDLLTADDASLLGGVGGNTVSVLLSSPSSVVGQSPFITASIFMPGLKPNAVVASDFNGDGNQDFVAASNGQSLISLYLGNGNGTFQNPVVQPTISSPIALVAADFDSDATQPQDLAILGQDSKGNALLGISENTSGAFGSATSVALSLVNPTGMAVGEFDGDTNPDLAVAGTDGTGNGVIAILQGNGDGTFQTQTNILLGNGLLPTAITAANFDGVNQDDLAVTGTDTSSNNWVGVLLNNGNATFAGPVCSAVGHGAVSVVADNFHGGTDQPDLAVANSIDDTVSILLNNRNGTGTFAPAVNVATGTTPVFVSTGDFNGAGNLGDKIRDLVTVNANSFDVSILLGNGLGMIGNGTFQPPINYVAGATPAAVAVADFNNDGAADLVAANAGGNSASVILNQPELPNFTITATPTSNQAGSSFSITVKAIFPSDHSADPKYQGTVHFTSTDPNAIFPSDLTFTAADMGVKTLNNVKMFLAGMQTITGTDTKTAAITGTGTVSIYAAAADHLVLTAVSPETAGSPFTVTVTAEDHFGNRASGPNVYTGTVKFASSDPNSMVVLPGPYTFTAGPGGDNGAHVFTMGFALDTAGTQTLTAQDKNTASIKGTSTVTVIAAAAAQMTMAAPGSTVAGNSFNVTLTLFDPFDNIATGYTGTVHFSSTDAQAGLPIDYKFAGTDKGVHTFSVTLKTAGQQTLTATDTVNGSLTASKTITVTPAPMFQLLISAPAVTTAGNSFNILVTAADRYGNAEPSYAGTVHLSSSDGQAVLPGDFTFAAGDQGVHTVTGLVLKTAGLQTLTATDTVTASFHGTATMSVVAAGANHLVLSAPATTTAGLNFTVTVTAEDQFGNVVTGFTSAVHFSTTDAQGTVTPSDYVFTTGDAGVHTFSVMLATVGSQLVTVSDAADGFSAQQTVVVSPAAASHFVLNTVPSTIAGSTFSVTVTALDRFGNVATGYTGTVKLTSSDLRSTLPGQFTFGIGDAGVHVFTVILGTAGSQTITATDVASLSITGSAAVTVIPGAGTQLSLAITSGTAGTNFTLTVAVLDAFGNVATGYAGTVHFSSSDGQATLPPDFQFGSTDQGIHTFTAILRTAGSQGITGTDTGNPLINGSAFTTVTPAAASHLIIGAPAKVSAGSAFPITVTALDAFGNVATGYTGTIHFSSSDAVAALPGNFTFSAADGGVHTFTVTMRNTVFQSLTATDVSTSSIGGSVLLQVIVPFLVTGADAGGGPEVRVFNGVTGGVIFDFFAYSPGFQGGVRVAVGDVNGDGVPDIITGPGPGGGPEIKVFDGKNGGVILDFMAFDPNFRGGVFVAAADVNGDGFADIIVGADAGGGPEVRVFSGKDGSAQFSFFAYDPNFAGGVRVAGGDINGDGHADIITAPGVNGGPEVRVFDGGTGVVLRDYMAYDPNFTGGVYVAAGDVNNDGKADIITGSGALPGQAANVRIFNGADGSLLRNFFAYPPGFAGGVRVGYIGDVNNDGSGDVLTAPGLSGGPDVEIFDGLTTNLIDGFFAYDPRFTGGVFVGG
jgi:hypothetical protein